MASMLLMSEARRFCNDLQYLQIEDRDKLKKEIHREKIVNQRVAKRFVEIWCCGLE